jgi:hypothetical protein
MEIFPTVSEMTTKCEEDRVDDEIKSCVASGDERECDEEDGEEDPDAEAYPAA